MRKGLISHWNDAKGYGFIHPADGGQDVFFHISKWDLSNRPREGMMVSFETQIESNYNVTATWVGHKNKEYAHNHPSKPPATTQGWGWLVKLIAFILVLAAIAFLWPQIQKQYRMFMGESAAQVESRVDNDSDIIASDPQITLTLKLIKQGGPFPYPSRDGSVFQNREGLLPKQANGYYREYTVPTPGASDRGARRIVTGGTPPNIFYYTADHYRSFQRIEAP